LKAINALWGARQPLHGLRQSSHNYEAEIRRRHSSKPERLLFQDEVFVCVCEASRAEVRIGHRLPRQDSNIEILSFADRHWWPLELPKLGLGHLATADLTNSCASEMSICSDSPCNPLRLAHCPLDEDLTIREIIENRYEAVLTAANRKVADNLLLIDGYPYARGRPFTTSLMITVRLPPPVLPGGISGSTSPHSSSLRSLGYRNLLRS
jgi:hypothetical protein